MYEGGGRVIDLGHEGESWYSGKQIKQQQQQG